MIEYFPLVFFAAGTILVIGTAIAIVVGMISAAWHEGKKS